MTFPSQKPKLKKLKLSPAEFRHFAGFPEEAVGLTARLLQVVSILYDAYVLFMDTDTWLT